MQRAAIELAPTLPHPRRTACGNWHHTKPLGDRPQNEGIWPWPLPAICPERLPARRSSVTSEPSLRELQALRDGWNALLPEDRGVGTIETRSPARTPSPTRSSRTRR